MTEFCTPTLHQDVARARGATDFGSGKARILPSDIGVTNEDVARSWYEGWDKANLSAPFSELV